MIDIRLVRDDIGSVKSALARRGVEPAEIDRLASLDAEARAAISHREEVRARVKALSREVGQARKAGENARAEELMAESRLAGDEERDLHAAAERAQEAVREALLLIPNLPSEEAPGR